MKRISLLMNVLIVTAVFWAFGLLEVQTSMAVEEHHQPGATKKAPASTESPGSGKMPCPASGSGPGMMGMMGPGSGYHGRGCEMMSHDRYMGRGMRGYGRGMDPDPQGWQDMPLEQRRQWRERRSRFMQETLPLRQELSSKQMELETLWDQKNPDPEKVKALSDRIAELRSKLDRKHDEYLTQCRQEIGDHGWACPGGGRWEY